MERSATDSDDLSVKGATHARPALTVLLLACLGLQGLATAQTETVRAPLSAQKVLQNLVRMNMERAQQLRSYQGWLPAQNHSLTLVRLGGRADLSIEYLDYQVTPTSPPGKSNDAALR